MNRAAARGRTRLRRRGAGRVCGRRRRRTQHDAGDPNNGRATDDDRGLRLDRAADHRPTRTHDHSRCWYERRGATPRPPRSFRASRREHPTPAESDVSRHRRCRDGHRAQATHRDAPREWANNTFTARALSTAAFSPSLPMTPPTPRAHLYAIHNRISQRIGCRGAGRVPAPRDNAPR